MALDNLQSQASHVFDQDDAQRDRHCPDFTDHQRLNLLVGLDETGENRTGHKAVGVGHISPSQAKNPRVAGERAIGQLWELSIIPGWQIVPDLSQLLFDKVEVVEQPFSRRSQDLARLYGCGTALVGLQKDIGILADPPTERLDAERISGRHPLRRRQSLRVMFEPLGPEKVRPDRRAVLPDAGNLPEAPKQ